jgi:ABC-type branched-subunit amino acid transport system substrate-binding protein
MSVSRKRFGRRGAALSVAAVAATSLVAAASSFASTAKVKFTGKPYVVAVNTPIASPYGDFPGSVAAAKASARAINASGGINGHQVEVISCKTQGDPNLELGCARKTVAAGAIATINSFIFSNPNGYLDELQKAHTADIGSEIVVPQFAQAKNVFPLTFGFGAFADCTGKAMAKYAGGDRISTYIAELPSSTGLENFMIAGAKAQGTDWVGAAGTPATVTDWTPIVQEAANLKPNIVIPGGGAQQFGPFLTTALSLGDHWSYCAFASGNLSKRLAPLGAAANSFYDGNALPTLASENQIPELKVFAAQMKAEQNAGDSAAKVTGLGFDWEMLQAWLAMQVFDQVATSIHGTVTPAKFLAKINKAKFSGEGIIPAINFAKPQKYGPFTRVFNPTTELERWSAKLDEFVVIPHSTINGAKLLFG